MSVVRGRVPVPRAAWRDHLREWRRESLWLWPAIAAIAAWVGGDLAARDLRSFTLHQGLFPTNLDDARTLLARVGATGRAHTVAQGAVGLAYLLVMASVIVFVVFVHSTVRSMRVTYIIEAVFRETLGAARTSFAEASAYREAELDEGQPVTARIAFDRPDAALDGIDAHRLAELASAHSCVLQLRVPVGAYVCRGEDVMEVLGGTSPEPAEILKAMNCSPVRTLYQDPSYGVRQLVDIAIRALSPAVNDPTTAVQSLDRLHGLLRAVAGRPDPSGCFLDSSGAVRLVEPVAGWDRLVDLAFTEIGLYGSGSPQVCRKLFAIFEDLAGCVPPERRPPIDALAAWLRAEVESRLRLPGDRALVADPQGLG